MLIHEVSKATGLTKKAIEYYAWQGLISPHVMENGYRNFNEDDVERLNKISVLRKLGISTEDIKTVLSDKSGNALQSICIRKELSIQREQAKKLILEKLSSGKSYSAISAELQAIDCNKTITEKLLDAFPGYYGRFICLHFARFLNEPIRTKCQQSAYERIITFLDSVERITLPEDLQDYLNEATKDIGTEHITAMLEGMKKSIDNWEDFLSDNKEMLEQYWAFKQSEEFKNSPMYKITEITKKFNSSSGYYDVFIPALKELSSSYAKYSKQLENANVKLLARYPEWENGR